LDESGHEAIFNRMEKLLLILVTVLALSANITQASTQSTKNDVVTHVLNSSNSLELVGAKNPTMEQLHYYWSIGDKLVDLLLVEPKNNKAWLALHKYRSFTDAGVTQMFNDACFRAFMKNPLIFYNRYMEGDDEAVNRAMDAAWGFSEGDSQSSNTEDVAFLYKNLSLVKSKNGKETRQAQFVRQFKKAIEQRKEELSQ
jgi:hypothetical protein